MSLHTQSLPSEIFALWIRTLRVTSDLSQESLAEAFGLSERTIQRIESSGRANRMTRRSLARGFGYDDHDIFDDPTFIATANHVLAEIFTERAKEEEAKYPDHVKLALEAVSSGAQIAGLIDSCDAWMFDCDVKAGIDGRNVSAVLFDNIQDYGEIWKVLSPSGRFEAEDAFTEMLADITSHGLCAYRAFRSGYLAPVRANQAAVSFNTGYLLVVPAEQEPSNIRVPNRD